MSSTITRYLGTFEVGDEGLIASDPCYDEGTWRAEHLPAISGTWHALVAFSDEGAWGTRVKLLSIYAEDAPLLITTQKTFTVGVDSGQFGFFDAEHYKDDSIVPQSFVFTEDWLPLDDGPWYSACCQLTVTGDRVGIMPQATGVVSSSGFGDGSYELLVSYDEDGNAIAALVTFIEDGDMEEDDDE